MTISTLISSTPPMEGNGINDVWPFTFLIPTLSDVQIVVADDSGNESILDESQFTITGIGNKNGGEVTYLLPDNYKIVIKRVLDFNQSVKLRDQRRYDPQVVEEALDRVVMMAQQVKTDVDRAVKLPITSTEDPELSSTITASVVTVSENIASVNTVADNMDKVAAVAAISASIVTNAENIADIINVSQGIGELNNGASTIVYNAASGVDFLANEIGAFRTNGFVKADATSLQTTEGFLAMAMADINGGSSGVWLVRGLRTELTGLVPSKVYYLTTTAGSIAFTPPYQAGNAVRSVGSTNADGVLYYDPSSVAPVVVEETNSYPPVLIESSSSAYSSANSFTCNWPPELQSGEHVLLIASYDSDGTSNTFGPPAAFSTSVAAFTKSDGSNEGVGMQAWLALADGTEGDTFTFTQNQARGVALVAIRISGLDGANPVSVAVVPDYAAASTPTLTSVAVPVDKTLLIAAACWDAGKTLVSAPAGFTALQHVDLNGSGAGHPAFHDLWVGYKAQAVAGATGALAFSLSGSEDWVGFNIVLQQNGATVGAPNDFVAPFNMADDGYGYPMKLTLPINSEGQLTGKAMEIFCSNSPDYVAGRPQLESYTHPLYFQRTSGRFRMSSPRDGATTSSNATTARCEFRHEKNYSPSERIRFKSTFALVSAADGADMVVCQIHRVNAAPIKAQLKVAADGSSISFRINARNDFIDSGDRPTDKDGKSKTITSSLNFNEQITCEMDWDQPTGNLKIWLNKANTNPPDLWYENMDPVDANGNPVAAYIKPAGIYVGTTTASPTDLITVDVFGFEIVTDSPSTAPTNLYVPSISGTPTQGQTLTASNGTWSGSSPISYAYQWSRGGVSISGATNQTYVLQAADVGEQITVTVTASNGVLPNASATSSSVLATGLTAPVNTVAPTISGSEQVDGVLSCTTGTWTGSAPIAYSYQWYVSPSTIISGATSSTYLLTASEQGDQVFCRVTATNGHSAVTQDSNTSGVIAAAPAFTLLSSAVSSVCFEVDATVTDSYSGSGVALNNIETTPADGSAQGDYDFTISGLTFNGTAGNAAAYLSSAGSGYIAIDAMTNFLKTLHKTSGTSFWFLMAGQFANAATNQTFFSTLGTAEDNTANNGLLVRTNTSEQPRIYQLTAGTPTKKSASPVQTLLLATPSFFAMSFNLSNGQITTWVPNGSGGITEVVTSITLQSNTADPDGIFRMMAATAATQMMVSGTRFYAAAMGNSTINVTELSNMLAILGVRHSRDYTP